MFANSNNQKKLSSLEEKGLQKRKVQFTESNQLSENKYEHDGWYSWINHLISIEHSKAIKELEAEISELEEELIQLKDKSQLKSDIEVDLKFVKCLAQHFHNPEEIVKELKSYIDEDESSRAKNRIKVHIVLIRYFAEKTKKELTQETNEFIEGIEIKYERESSTISPRKTNPESPYAASDENTAKQYNKVAYHDKLEELRDLIIYAKNNFDDDVYARLLIRVNNCIFSNSQHGLNGKNSDLIVNPDDFDYKGRLFFNVKVSKKIQEAFTHAETLRDCVKELLKINHGNFDQIFGDIKDLMKPVLKQSDEAPSPSVHPPQNPQAKPNTNKARNINDIFPISKAHYSFESYASGRGVVELSKAEIRKINQYTKSIKNSPNDFTKKVILVRDLIIGGLDGFEPETLKKYISEGKIEVLEKYLDVIEQYFKTTADILVELGQKKELYAENLVEIKRRRLKKILNKSAQSQNGSETNGDAESEAQKERKHSQQRAQSADNAPEEGTPTLNPQITTNKPQGESNVYDNKGFYKEIMSVVGAIVGAIIGATIAYLAGAALPIIAAVAVISAVPGVLIGYGIAEICEKVSGERKNDPKMGILTALSIVLTSKCMSGGDVAKT